MIFAPSVSVVYAVAAFYRSRMTTAERAAADRLLAFQANPTSDLEPIFEAVARLRRFWRMEARAVVLDTATGKVLSGVSAVDDENNPGRFLSLTVDDQVSAVLGHSLAWVLA